MTYVRSKTEKGRHAGDAAVLGPTEDSSREIAAEHRRIRALVAELEDTRDLEALRPRLAALRGLLESHFAREEAPGGLHRVVDRAAPRLASSVQALFDEHRDFLAQIDGLEERVRVCLEGPLAEIRQSVAALCRGLHEHEAVETDLLAGALYEDIGGGD